jgi:hypothetical protein
VILNKLTKKIDNIKKITKLVKNKLNKIMNLN